MKHVAVIFAGGVGSRMGSETPKQFLEWNGKAVIIHTLEVFENTEGIDGIVLACKEDWIPYTRDIITRAGLQKVKRIVPGGATALESQFNGLMAVKELYQEENVGVLIHDGVRPLVTPETIKRCVKRVETNGNAITVTPAIETVINVDKEGRIQQIMDRSLCKMAKAPQCFLLDELTEVHKKAMAEGIHSAFIDSASMMLHYGKTLHTVPGEMENIKITTPSDYYMFLGISQARKEAE